MKQLRVFAILLTVSLAPFLTAWSQARFEVPLTVSDGVNTYVMGFGIIPGGHYGVWPGPPIGPNPPDSINGHVEGEAPPFPPGGVFDARFSWPGDYQPVPNPDPGPPDGFGQGTLYDYRPFTSTSQSDTFIVNSQRGTGATVTLTWPSNFASLWSGSVQMINPNTSVVLVADMKTTFTKAIGALAPDVMIVANGPIPPSPGYHQTTVADPTNGLTMLFGPVMVGNTTDLVLTVTNPGLADLHVASVGSSSGKFTLVSPPVFPVTVVPAGVQTFTVRYTPTLITSDAGRLTITHDAASSPDTVHMTGQGTGITQVVTTPLHFGNVHILDSGDLTVTVSNASAVLPFDVTSIDVPAGGQYAITPPVVRTITPGGNTVYHVVYTPTALGLASGNVTFHFSVAEGPTDVAVDGTGITAFSMTAGPVHFGNVFQGSTGSDNTISVTNNATAGTMHINAIAASGVFSVTTPPGAFDVLPGASQVLTLQFAPTAVGFASGSFSVVHNGGGAAGSLGVDGTGLSSVSATNAAFGTVQMQSPPICVTPYPTMSVTVTNNSGASMDITGAAPSPADYSVVPNPATAYPITLSASGGSYNFDVTFAPAATGSRPGTVTFGLSGVPATVVSNLTGTGQPCVEPTFVTVTPDSMTKLVGLRQYFEVPVRRTRIPKMPNWTNLMDEVVGQGGFSPASSESDVAGGMRIGKSFMRGPVGVFYVPRPIASDTAWARLTRWIPSRSMGINWGTLQQTLKTRLGALPTVYVHDNFARGLDSTKNPGDIGRRLLKGQQSLLSPRYTKNKLFAELVALKFNIAANDLGTVLVGPKAGSVDALGLFGGLMITMAGNPLSGMSIRDASALCDSFMTFERNIPTPTWFDDAYACVYAINRAFVGPLDTLSFYAGPKLRVNGVRGASATGGLLTPGAASPVIVQPTNNETEFAYGANEGDETIGDPNATVPSMKLYQNYPNPFNPSTFINFNLVSPAEVTVKVYNVLGQEIATLMSNEVLVDGYQSFSFDANGLASGVYYYTVTGRDLETGAEMPRSLGKMLLMK